MNKSVDNTLQSRPLADHRSGNMTNIHSKLSPADCKVSSSSDRDNSRRIGNVENYGKSHSNLEHTSKLNFSETKGNQPNRSRDTIDGTTSDRVKQEYISRNRDSSQSAYQSANIPLLLFDMILLPIIIIRMVLIYFWGSKYNLKGFQFLDVIMHADNPYFNQEDCRLIDTIGKDYRVVIRDDSRLFPLDLVSYVRVERETEKHISVHGDKINVSVAGVSKASDSDRGMVKSPAQIIVGSTVNKIPSIWEISSDEFVDDHEDSKDNHKETQKNSPVQQTVNASDENKGTDVINNQNTKNTQTVPDKKSDTIDKKGKVKETKDKDTKDNNVKTKKHAKDDDSDSESEESEDSESSEEQDDSEEDTENTETNETETESDDPDDTEETENTDDVDDKKSKSATTKIGSKKSQNLSKDRDIPKINVKIDVKNPLGVQQKTNQSKKPEVKGVNYFESNDDGSKKRDTKKRNDILDSIKEELNSAFDP